MLGDGFVVSVDRDGTVLEGVRQDLEDDPELAGAGLAAVLPCLVDHAAEGYGPVLGALNNAVEEVEEAVFSPARARPTERIYQLSRRLLEFRRAAATLTEMLDRLAAGSSTAVGERLKQRYRERRAHLLHLVELADGLGNLLSNVLQANLTEASVRQNDDMRRISAWVAIWAIPTLLADISSRSGRVVGLEPSVLVWAASRPPCGLPNQPCSPWWCGCPWSLGPSRGPSAGCQQPGSP